MAELPQPMETKQDAGSGSGFKRNSRPSSIPKIVKKARLDEETRWQRIADSRQLRSLVLQRVFPDRDVSTHNDRAFSKLPGPLPSNLTRALLSVFKQQLFWVCEKSDGLRYMLFIQKGDAAYLIDRSFEFYKLADSSLYLSLAVNGDTLLDGELVLETSTDKSAIFFQAPNGKRQAYLIYDCVMLGGQSVVTENFETRMGERGIAGAIKLYKEALHKRHEAKEESVLPFHLQSKYFRKHYHVAAALQCIRSEHGEYVYEEARGNNVTRSNKNDGLVFTPQDEGYIQQRTPIYKFKWADKCSIDFLIRPPFPAADENRKMTLFIGGTHDALIACRTIDLPIGYDAFLREVPPEARDKDCVVELVYDKKIGKWKYLTYRPEKNKPNFIEVAFATLEAAIDDLTREDLIATCVKPSAG